MRNEHGTDVKPLLFVEVCSQAALRDPKRSMMLVSDTEYLVRYSPAHVMCYLELVLYAFAKFVIWYSVVLLLGIVAVEVATCPIQSRFVISEWSGATYVRDRSGDIARFNAVLREHLHPGNSSR
jgi:hypothetical protein